MANKITGPAFKKNKEGKFEITYKEYDNMLAAFENMSIMTVYPTIKQIDMMKKEPEKWLFTCCYLYEKGRKPVTNEEKYNRKNLWNFINEIIEFVDDEEEEC